MTDLYNMSDYEIYEVFSQKSPTSSFSHQFSLLAPNPEMALVLAQENFMRREEVYNIWVVKRENIHAPTEEQRKSLGRLDNKNYRETRGYGDLQAKWREHRMRYEHNCKNG